MACEWEAFHPRSQWKQWEQEFKVRADYTASSKLAYGTKDMIQKLKKKEFA